MTKLLQFRKAVRCAVLVALSVAGLTQASAQVTLTQTSTSDFMKGTGSNVVFTNDQVLMQAKMTEIYDYEATTNLPQTLMNHQMVTWQNYVFCVGGYNGSNPVNTVYRAQIQDGGVSSWTTLNAMPVALMDMAVVATQTNLIVMGGRNNDGVSDKIYVASIDPLNAAFGNWTESVVKLPQPIYGARAVTVHDNIYLIGGANPTTDAIKKVYCLKLNSRGNVASCTQVTALPQSLNGHAVATYGSKIYVLGGHNASGVLKNTVYSATVNLNGSLSAWQTETAMPMALKDHTAVCTNGILAFIGGMGTELPGNQLYYTYLDNTQLEWNLSNAVLSMRTHSGASCVYNNFIYFSGGKNLSDNILNFMRYATIGTGDEMVGQACFVSRPFDLGIPMKTVQQLTYNLTQGSNTSYEVLYRTAGENKVFSEWISAGTDNPVSINLTKADIQYMFRMTATGTENIQLQDVSVSFSGYTQLAGNLNDISVISSANSPYMVTGSISFTTGIHDIEAGVVMYFAENTELKITQACVRFNGTEDAPILLTYRDADQKRWNGVHFEGAAEYNRNGGVYGNNVSYMNYTTVENAGYGDNESNLWLVYSNMPTFTNCIFNGSSYLGIRANYSNPTFTNCTISNSVSSGLFMYYSNPTLVSSIMTGNRYGVDHDYQAYPSFTNCSASGNTFGVYSWTPDRDFIYDESTLALFDNDIEIRTAGGYINNDRSWNYYDNGYQVDGDLYLNNSSNRPTLTIAAGNTIRMASGKKIDVDYGGIYAVGTETDSITFTALNGQVGGWNGFEFGDYSDANAASTMRYCVIEKASTNIYCNKTTQPSLMYSTVRQANSRNIHLYESDLNLDAVHISDSYDGLYLYYNSVATMVMTSFDNISHACVWNNETNCTENFYTCSMSNSNIGVGYYDPNVDIPAFATRITFSNVTSPVGLRGGRISSNRTWMANDYGVLDDINIGTSNTNDTVRLTIDPGATLRFAQGKIMGIGHGSNTYNGELYAEGTEESPITFTSLNGMPGGWNGLYFNYYTRSTLLKHCVFENGNSYNVYVEDTNSPIFENCEFRNANGFGIRLQYASPVMENCAFNDNGSYGVYFERPLDVKNVMHGLQFTGNSVDGIAVEGGTINANRTWPAYDYIVLDDINIGASNTNNTVRLTIDPGATLHFAQGKIMEIGHGSYTYNGELYAEGTEESPITFTSLNGMPGGWNGLYFNSYTRSTLLKHCVIENGNQYNVYMYSCSPVFENCEFRNANGYGIRLNYASPVVGLSSIHDNANHGIYLEYNCNPTIGNSPEMGNDIVNNGGYAIYQYGSNDVNMAYNFFGTTDSIYIENNLLYDKLDNQNKGRVNVFPVSMLPVTSKVLEGSLLYDSNPAYPMEGSAVMVKTFADSLLYQTTTDATGHFSIGNMSFAGAKKLDFTPNVDVESTITTADALAVMLHYVHESMLAGNRLAAADVNESHTVNGTDALLIQKRYVNQIETFPAGDVYYHFFDTIAYSPDTLNVAITALSFGDVNGSYAPSTRGGVILQTEGQMLVGSNQTYNIPVHVKNGVETGAISLKLNYPAEYINVEDVTLANHEEVMLYDNNGQLTISWYSLNPMYLTNDETLLWIKVRTNDLSDLNNPLTFGLDVRSELTDGNAFILSDVVLAMPELANFSFTGVGESDNMALSVYPNPMRDRSVISYCLPAEGRVSFTLYDLLGNTVQVFEEGRLNAGQHEIELKGLASGVYMGRLAVSGSREEVQIVKIVVE